MRESVGVVYFRMGSGMEFQDAAIPGLDGFFHLLTGCIQFNQGGLSPSSRGEAFLICIEQVVDRKVRVVNSRVDIRHDNVGLSAE